MDQDYTRWIVVDNVDSFDGSDVLWNASGYIILKDGSRLALQRHLGALPKFAHAKPRVYSRRRPG